MLSLERNELRSPVSDLSVHPARHGIPSPDRLVTFLLNEQSFAIPLEYVERALRMVAVTPVPNAPQGILGIINLSGRLVPVLDLRPCLGLPATSPSASDRLLVLTIEGRTLAVFATEVCAVTTLSAQPLEATMVALSQSALVKATLQQDTHVTFVLDVVQIAALVANTKELR